MINNALKYKLEENTVPKGGRARECTDRVKEITPKIFFWCV